jgi:hypothetical protein
MIPRVNQLVLGHAGTRQVGPGITGNGAADVAHDQPGEGIEASSAQGRED